jgi:hypothetical protein
MRRGATTTTPIAGRAANLRPTNGRCATHAGVRRFFVEDPGGTIVNVLAHIT